jgi:uroporphyrinogen decarboxylase
LDFLKTKPHPDFDDFTAVLKGTKKSAKVHYAELVVDEEIKKVILEEFLEEEYFPPPVLNWGGSSAAILSFDEKKTQYKKYYEKTIKFYYCMGYSMVTDMMFMNNFEALNPFKIRSADTSMLSKGERYWANEKTGVIRSWEDFEKFPWETPGKYIDEYLYNLDVISKILPDGMKIGISGTFFEEPLEWIFGFENLFYLMSDNPELVAEVYSKVGKIIYDFYNAAIGHESVGGIFHADDLGYKNATLISVKDLEKLVFPWFKKYSYLAHTQRKPFFLHCCGKKSEIMDILIDDVQIDGIHSFEDASYPVKNYLSAWGNRVGIMGGIDIDKLVRLDESDLKIYIRDILDFCVPNGRYVCGTGNSVANYIPVKNYIALINECTGWNQQNR